MVNAILAKRVNHIVTKGDNPAWPKGSKSRGFSNWRYKRSCLPYILTSNIFGRAWGVVLSRVMGLSRTSKTDNSNSSHAFFFVINFPFGGLRGINY